jgi:hypothetical protein
MYDMNDAELPRGSDLIPDGSFAKVTMAIRKGGLDGQGEVDRGLLKPARNPESDVRMLDCEFTVVVGPHIRRKFWQTFTVVGGKVDEQGVSIGWKISKGIFRAMIDSALGLDPQDMSEAAKAKRVLRGLADLHGITFAAKVRVEPASDSRYGDNNRLDRVVLPGEPEYRRVMDGEAVPASPSHRAARPAVSSTPANTPPAWATSPAQPAPSTPARSWERPAPAAPAQAAAPLAPPPAPASGGPAWLNG